MRALTWIIFGFLVMGGFGAVVTAEEGGDDSPKSDIAADGGVDPDGGLPDDGGDIDAGDMTPPPPPPPEKLPVDESVLPEVVPKVLPFSKGSMELALGVSLSGNNTENYLGVAARYGYYVIDSLALGVDLRYTHVFVDDKAGYDFPESLTLLPYAKYILTRKAVAPYALVTGGYEFEWGADNATNAWILGLGGGVHVTVSKHVRINIELSALHYWYSDTKVYWYEDGSLLRVQGEGNEGLRIFEKDCHEPGVCEPLKGEAAKGDIILLDADGKKYHCTDRKLCGENAFKDKKDRSREWFFPLISVGVGFVF